VTATPRGKGVSAAIEVEIGGRAVRLTNLDKVLFPATGFTKGDLIDYYARLAPVLLPHLAGRPLTLARFPDGVDGSGWYQTDCPHPPPLLLTLPVPSPGGQGRGRNYCLVDDLAGLVWTANLAAIELHPLLSRVPRLDVPTVALFDLDPGPPAGLIEAASVALLVRQVLEGLGLEACVKTSGWFGMHVVVPLNGPHTFDETRTFARAAAAVLARRHPDQVVGQVARSGRAGRVFVDWAQNNANRSIAGVYSVRAQDEPVASTPLRWSEAEAAVAAGDPGRLRFDAPAVLRRVDEHGDLFASALELRQRLPALS
jgi:bifunctional non-homologous end joining protein LigD